MRSAVTTSLCAFAAVFFVAIGGGAQEKVDANKPASMPGPADPRVGLKPGLRDAGEAAKGLQRISSLPKPEGFFNPKQPAGDPTAPERTTRTPAEESAAAAAESVQPPSDPATAARRNELRFSNSDLAFKADRAFIGNFNGFNTYDIEDPKKVHLIASVVCPGGQGDVSVYGNLLFMSVEETRGRIDCGTQGIQDAVSAERFRGVRIFDISDVRKPKQIAAVQTCRGSHTHTLVTNPNDKANVYIYGSGTGSVRSGEELAGCSTKDPKEDPNTSRYSIDVIQVPLAAPETARIVNRPRIFADSATGEIAGLHSGGSHGTTPDAGPLASRATDRCHDVTVFPELGLAAGACAGNGILLDISDPVHPVRLDYVSDKNFAFWHSATFNNDGSKIIFTDEWGGGTRPRCRSTDPPSWGADAVFDIVDRKLRFGGYYKMPAAQTEQENCVAHNGSLIPVPGRDIMVQAWYQGGVSVFDFTDSTHPVEIAFFDRGPLDATKLITGGYWSTYWYNGHIYASEIARGVDVFKLTPSEFLSQNEIDAAMSVHSNEFNAQQQTRMTWPASAVVARAYLDQLTRSKGIQAERAASVKSAIDRADRIRSPRDRGAAAVMTQLETLASQLESDASSSSGRDADRLRSLASTLKALPKK